MRVAYVCADPGVPVFGCKGCSIHAQGVLTALLKLGARIDLFAASTGDEPPPGLENVVVYDLPAPPKGDQAARERSALAANSSLAALLEEQGPYDLVYERYSLWSFAGMEYARRHGLPGVLEVNAPLIDEQQTHRDLIYRATAERVATRIFDAAEVLIAVSSQVARYLEGFVGTHGRVHVVNNGVDIARFPDRATPTHLFGHDTFTVGFIGTLKPWHGLRTLVDAFDVLYRRSSNSRMLVVGDGPEREILASNIAARGLKSAVHLTGAVAPARVAGLLASMDVGVAPYPALPDFYFSPLKVVEYMAAGLPVVASETGQLAELIDDGVNGLLVPPGDHIALAAAIESLRREPRRGVRMGATARRWVQRQHTWDAVVGRILDLAGIPCRRHVCPV